jgi:riboflavin synthase
MFTGLIKDIGTIKSISKNAEGKEFVIETNKLASEIAIDDSVATNGVCLTATQIKGNTFKVQAVHVTLEKTNIGKLNIGDKVNLELALRPVDRLGGHFVQGHVNGTGKIKSIRPLGKNYEITLSAPNNLFKYMIPEGSIAIDGISLTIAKLTSDDFSVSIIPHTYENTILHSKKVGDSVNIEVDMMAKYLENFMHFAKKDSKFDLESWYKEQN